MANPEFVLKFAHLSRGRISDPRILQIIEEERRAFDAHVAKIWAEQERENARIAARPVKPIRLTLAPRYAKGIAQRRR